MKLQLDIIKNQKFEIGRTINPFKCDCDNCDFLHCPKSNYAVKTKPHKYKVREFCQEWHDTLATMTDFIPTSEMLDDLIGECFVFPKGTYWSPYRCMWNNRIDGIILQKISRKGEPIDLATIVIGKSITEYDLTERQYKLALKILNAFEEVIQYIEVCHSNN